MGHEKQNLPDSSYRGVELWLGSSLDFEGNSSRPSCVHLYLDKLLGTFVRTQKSFNTPGIFFFFKPVVFLCKGFDLVPSKLAVLRVQVSCYPIICKT